MIFPLMFCSIGSLFARKGYVYFKAKKDKKHKCLTQTEGKIVSVNAMRINRRCAYFYTYESDLELLKIRSTNQAPYEAISDRIPINELDTEAVYYRGDSYICTFTHRLNRNFTSDSAPTNDLIVDELTLDKYIDSYENGDDEHNINVGDLNVVDIGTWFTFPIISNYNLNVRSLDESNADEMKIIVNIN